MVTCESALWFKSIIKDNDLVEKIKAIKLIIVDIDGSLTDGTVECTNNSEGTRWFSTQDGYGTRKTMQIGIKIAFVSGKGSESGLYRAKMLGIHEEFCFLGVLDKRIVATQLQKTHHITSNELCVYGDDFLDAQIKLSQKEVLFVAPENAPFYIQSAADMTLPLSGGNHAFRLMLDLILYVKKQHFAQDLIAHALL